ncbi:hypothetical protein V8F20_006431 [Naviculisporaceae sp. PSN 640]
MHLTKWSSGKGLPSKQPSGIAPNEDDIALKACQTKRPISWADSDCELVASGSAMGRSSSTATVSSRCPAARLPIRAHTVAARTPISFRVDLGERQNKVVGQIETPEILRLERTASRLWDRPGTRASTGDDIELDDITSPPLATQSTDHLVPCPGRPQSDLPDSEMAHHAPEQQLRPDYKPMSLRWPFQLFLLTIIACLLAFLEYHIHDTPPLHYSVIDMHSSLPSNDQDLAIVRRPAVPKPFSLQNTHTITGAQQASTAPSASKTYVTKPIVFPPKRGLRVRDPDPRPPESEFPVPNYWEQMTKTYCGWERPTWMIDRWAESCEELSCDKFPILCSDAYNTTQLQCSYYLLTEFIPSFLTDDPSWCPCGVWVEHSWIAPIELDPGEIEDYYWGTIDRGCKSLMLALQSIAHFKTARLYHTVDVLPPGVSSRDPWGWPLEPMEEPQYYTTPPLPARGWWVYPNTAENGDVLMPLVVRTAGPEISDIFGNKVGPADIATFPEGFASQYFQRVTKNKCLLSKSLNNLQPGPDYGCTEPPQVILSTIWWKLPLGHPTTATPTTVDASTTSSIVSTSTSTAEVRSTSTHIAPSTSTIQASTVGASTKTSEDIPRSTFTLASNTSDQNQQPTSESRSERPASSSPTREPSGTTPTEDNTEAPTTREPSSRSTTNTSRLPELLDSTGLPVLTSSAAPDNTLQETMSDTTSSPALLPIVGLLPSSKRESSGKHAQETNTGIMTTSKQAPAQFVTTLSTQFNLNNVPTQTLTVISPVSEAPQLISPVSEVPPVSPLPSSPSSKLAIEDLIPPPPFVIPPGSSWNGTRLDNNSTGKPGGGQQPGPHSGPVNPENQRRFFNLRTEADYLMASVLPVLLATLLLIPVQIFTNSVNSILPFRALSWGHSQPEKVVSATDSLLLPRSNNIFVSQPRVSYRFLRDFKDYLPLLNVAVGLFGLVMVPLSSEVIRLEFSEECLKPPDYRFWPEVCAYGLRKSETLIRVAEGFLVTMGALIIGMGWILARWKSGVPWEPWSIASMASLLAGSPSRPKPQLASLLRSIPTSGTDVDTQLTKTLQDYTFRVGLSREGTDNSYGIEVTPKPPPAEHNDKNPIPQNTARDPPDRRPTMSTIDSSKPHPLLFWRRRRRHNKTIPLRLILALVLTTGLLILILYYENVVVEFEYEDRKRIRRVITFEQFMNSQSFGVRILFTTFGVIISSFWDSYFLRLSESQIHRRLARAPSLAQNSILLSPPSNIFAGLWQSILHIIIRRDRADDPDLLSFNIALATFFAKFTPIMLSNIPFHNTVTWKMHEACTWMAVFSLSYMVLVLLSIVMSAMGLGVFEPWWSKKGREKRPKIKMPVRVNTIAGAMYYICDSGMLKDFEGLSMKDDKQIREAVVGMEKRYVFWEMTGTSSGTKRLGVDYYQYRGPDVHLPILLVGKSGPAVSGADVERQL